MYIGLDLIIKINLVLWTINSGSEDRRRVSVQHPAQESGKGVGQDDYRQANY